MLIDAHLDLAMNALRYERDPRQTVAQLRTRERDGTADGRGVATMSLPALRQAGVAVANVTLLARCKPWIKPGRTILRGDIDYPDPTMAYAAAQGEWAYYRLLAAMGELRLLGTRADWDDHCAQWEPGGTVGVTLMLEGADPIVNPAQLGDWYRQGVRCLSLAHYGHSRYAAGTPSMDRHSPEQDGPLTARGVALLREMQPLGMALDLTHTADQSLAQALDLYPGPVCATHCNARALCGDTPRQLTDAQIQAIAQRGGVVGAVCCNPMIKPRYGQGVTREDITLADLADHVDHICQLTGCADHVGIGSDLDGGFGADMIPRDMDTYPDLLKLGPLLRERGFGDAQVHQFFAGNWARFWRSVLPDKE